MLKSILCTLFLLISFMTYAVETDSTEAIVTKQTEKFQAGIHYEVLSPGIVTENKKPVMYEFFGYTCPGCNAMQPVVNAIEEDNTFELIRVPVVFHESWEPYAKTYHTLELMDMTEKTHAAIFKAIHVNKKIMRNTEQIADWLSASFEINKEEFLSMSKSFAVDGKMRQAEKLRQSLNINNTPTLIINGKYKPNMSRLSNKQNIVEAAKELLSK